MYIYIYIYYISRYKQKLKKRTPQQHARRRKQKFVVRFWFRRSLYIISAETKRRGQKERVCRRQAAVKFRPALFLGVLGVVGAVEEASLEQLDGDDGEDEVEEHVDDHDVDDVLERVDDAVEHRLHPSQHHTTVSFTLHRTLLLQPLERKGNFH